ncbi:MAG: BTAD domain-containing putative transcriptional regulator [Burkholderiales bacterium]
MAETLVVRLLGPPRIALATNPVACTSRKALALFAFLALSARPHPRRELAALFWGRRDEDSARASLRVALARLPRPMADCLQADRETIGIAIAPDVDVARLEALAAADDLASLEQATELYQGEFLQDFEAEATPEFDDWLHAQRTRLAQLAQQVFDDAIARRADRARHDASRATAERESALALARRWASLMPESESAHRTLMRIYLETGHRDAAIAQYELCQRLLAVNHGRAPSPETRELYDIARGRNGAKDEPAADRDALLRAMVPTTSFVGRVEELAELERLLADPHCRLLTLHGLGGAGKTRLAHALTTQVSPRFARGACWVALESLDSPDMLPAALAAALGRDAPAQGDQVAAVADMLADQERLVVLDNMESLLAHEGDPLALVLRILERAPRVRVLVTSREVLGLQEEWVYDVQGLDFDGASTPAVELFVQRARQAYLGFSAPAEMPHVLRICTLVEGLPLGIELAAAWVRTIPCGEIAGAIEREVFALASPHRNRADRHRTLDAVMTYSWNLLRGDEQQALAALSVFAGGFTREVAERVADASTRTLSTLVDKSLVRRHPTGRYDLHELVRQFAWSRLRRKRAREAEVVRRHADAYARLLLQWFAEAKGPDEAAAQGRLRTDLANILAAWERSLEPGGRDIVERMAPVLIEVLRTQARVPAALRTGEQAIAALGRNARSELLCAVRMEWGRTAVTAGQRELGRRELEAAFEIASELGNPSALGRCLYYLTTLRFQQGQVAETEATVAELFRLAERSGDLEVTMLAGNAAGTIANMSSQFELAERHMRNALAAARQIGAPSYVGAMLCSLNVPVYYRGGYTEAAALLEEAAGIFERVGRNTFAIGTRSNLGAVLLTLGRLDEAREHVKVAIRMARDAGERNQLCMALTTSADILIERREFGQARADAEEGSRLATAIGNPLIRTEALYLLATVELRDGHVERVLPLLRDLREELTQHRLDVRVPMLVLATAEWILTTGDDVSKPRARGWLAALSRLQAIDATLRDKAKRLLGGDATDDNRTLAEVEADVLALLDALSRPS